MKVFCINFLFVSSNLNVSILFFNEEKIEIMFTSSIIS